ncbi:MAG TPA: sulfatase-like hydrolase/transferase [Verrucomicrobiae bacterium]|nr:sulfatase-like hydrolase/transferase [Verrucomicrobiae bacterium]
MSENRPSDGADSRRSTARWAIPWDVGGRIGLLFVVLCVIKLTMLAGFRMHLFEIHWRTRVIPLTWLNEAEFYIFSILIGLNLWQFGMRCHSLGGVKAVRMGNAFVLVIAAAFIFLTFHIADNNYLYPVMVGTLSWWDLRWYLDLAFFFQLPYLAAWVSAYALTYYVLARTGRERLVLHVTAVFAAIYTALFLRDLMAYRYSLLVVDCLGTACLLACVGSQRPPRWFWLIQPWLWCAFLFFLFRPMSDDLKHLDPECAVLSGWSIVLFGGMGVLAWRGKFLQAWWLLLPFAFTAFLLLVDINYDLADNYRKLFCLGLTLPRYFLGEFSIATILLALATVYRKFLPKASLLWLDIINFLLITLALADLRLSQIMGIRLDWQAVEFGADPKMIFREAKPYLPELFLGLAVLAALYAILIGLWQRGSSSGTLRMGRGGLFCLVSFLLLGATGDWLAERDKAEGESAILLVSTSPLFERVEDPTMNEKTFVQTANHLGLADMLRPPAVVGHSPRDLNVVIIFQESSYNKYLSLFNGTNDTEPLLSKYKDRMELFPDFFSDFAGSINARFATFAGLYPVRDYKMFTFNHVPVKSLFDILHENGYQCSVYYSSFLDYTGFRDFLENRGVDPMYDADTMPGRRYPPVSWGIPEEETLRAMQSQIQQYATNHQKFFLTYVPVAPHNPFDGTPDQFRKYPPGQVGDYTPLYLNQLLYMDWVIASILHQLEDSGLLDHTLVIITDDHGEMLGENGGPIGHGWAVTPALTDIPLIVMDPDHPGYYVNDTIGSQVDLLPTVLDLLGIPVPENQFYQGISLYSDAAQAPRTIYLNSLLQYGVIEGHYFLCGSRETGEANGVPSDVYYITNDGARTFFVKTRATNKSIPPISAFDNFQQNLLQNYYQYQQTITNSP